MRRLLAAFTAVMTMLVLFAVPAQAAPAHFQMPFRCGEAWNGQTRTNHNPQNSIDFAKGNALGQAVVASAAGTVTTVRNLGNSSYGRYVVVDHGGGWTTWYAHLNRQDVSVGQRVNAGTQLGTVGSTGNSTGPHLHYEQRLNGSAQRITFDGAGAFYWGSRSYTSRNCSGGGGGGGGTGSATGTVQTTTGIGVNIRSGPGTNFSIVGSVAHGQRVTIQCQTTGEWITGRYPRSNIWNRIGNGQFIPDAYTYTGANGFVAPRC